VPAVEIFTHFGDPLDSLRCFLEAAGCGLPSGLHSIGKRLGQFVKAWEQPRNAA
jgi:hypothetical protein